MIQGFYGNQIRIQYRHANTCKVVLSTLSELSTLLRCVSFACPRFVVFENWKTEANQAGFTKQILCLYDEVSMLSDREHFNSSCLVLNVLAVLKSYTCK